MVINESKCNTVTFNFSEKKLKPSCLILNGNEVKAAKSINLLGVNITDDLSWKENTNLICKKVNKKLFYISKMKQFDFRQADLLKVWTQIIRNNAEYAAPLWHSGLTVSEVEKIESLQKKVFALIFGTEYQNFRRLYKVNGKLMSYEEVLGFYGLQTMFQRREDLTKNFATRTLNSTIHCDFFEEKNSRTSSRRNILVEEYKCKTARYFNSAIPYMARMLNASDPK